MREVVVTYHRESEGCWADSSDVEGFVVAGDSLRQVRELVMDGLSFYLDGEQVDLYERMDESDAPLVVSNISAPGIDTWSASQASTIGWVEHARTTSAPVGRLRELAGA